MLGPLPLLLVGELFAGGDLPILRLDLLGVGAGSEAVQPVLLVGGEVHTHGHTLRVRGGQARGAGRTARAPSRRGAKLCGSIVSACTRVAPCDGVAFGVGPERVAGFDAPSGKGHAMT